MSTFYYKFRVFYDDVEDFRRDIEILSTDNFESFHKILFSSIGLIGNELSSFSICDSKWNKKNEITLIDMCDDQEMETPQYEEDDDFSSKSRIPKFVMKNAILKDFITEPHQNLIYEYDFLHPKIFYLELMKTLPIIESNVEYPRCTLKVKELPKQVERISANPEDILDLDDDTSNDDPFAFDDNFMDEDIADFGTTDGFDD